MPIIRWGYETEIVDIEWIWKPMIPRGKVTIIEGDGGDGKTTLILTIAAMVSVGIQPPTLYRGHLFPSESIPPLTTFYLTNEDEVADSSLKRFIRAGGDAHHFAYSGELEHHMTLNEEELRAAIDESKAELIIIDPFQAFLPEGTNMGSITKMRTIFTMLGNVAKSTGVAIVLVGHLNKSEGSKDIHRGFGSADIAASVRSILMVEMDKKNRGMRRVRAIKSNFDESDYTPIRLILDDERKLSFAEDIDDDDAEEPIKRKSKIDQAESIIRDMLEYGRVPVDEILDECDAIGIGNRTVRRAASERLGVISRSVAGVTTWELPD